MMKNILIPTDFNVRSLKIVSEAINLFSDDTLNITLIHPVEVEQSISSLLMLNKRIDRSRFFTTDFMEACEIVKKKNVNSIEKLNVELLYHSTRIYLRRFMEARQIDAIILPSDYEFEKPSPQSVDIIKELAKFDRTCYVTVNRPERIHQEVPQDSYAVKLSIV